jgi:microcin C transport system substrate-binding protein
VLTVREEFVSKTWATEYVFPAVTGGRVAKETIPDRRPSGAQGFFFNLRRPQFADPRVREALDHAFDFEWSNRNLFYGLYQRTQSFFENSPLKAEGPPSREERALLEPFRGEVPEEVFGEPYVPPVSDGSGLDRRLLRRASELLAEAGWHRKDGALRNADGEVFRIEFLDNDSSFERVINPFVRNLHLLGIDARLRIVDPAQFELRLKNFDYDVVTRRYNLSLTPGEGLRQLFGSKAADTPGSDNLAGIRLGVVDSLIDRIIAAETREEMTVAARALDRVLRAERVWVPQWYKPVRTLAVWQMYGRPQRTPRYSLPLETVWWYDAEKAAAIGMATGQ